MIERLLAADRALESGDLEVAARLFGQVAEADPRNAIAVVGLARVALGRGDRTGAQRLAATALTVDPDDAAARRLLDDLGAAAEAPSVVAAPSEPASSEPAPAAPAPSRGGLLGWLRRTFGR